LLILVIVLGRLRPPPPPQFKNLTYQIYSPCVIQSTCSWVQIAWISFQDTYNIEVAGILNDAVGTLMSCAHKNGSCRIGVIVGKSKNNFEYHMDRVIAWVVMKLDLWMIMNYKCYRINSCFIDALQRTLHNVEEMLQRTFLNKCDGTKTRLFKIFL
jgi:hypothetical protein